MRGKRTANAVPILSRISMVAIAVSAAAMIVVFSVFNGLEGIVKDLYKAFYPDVKITAARGKFFAADPARMDTLRKIQGIQQVSTVIEDNVLANSVLGEQKVVSLKGIDNNYFAVNEVGQYISLGEDTVSMGHPYTAIAGARVLNELGADVTNIFSKIELFYLNTSITNPESNPTAAYESLILHPAGMFTVGDEFDSKYVLAPLPLVQQLFGAPGKYSSIEIKTLPGRADKVREEIQKLFGGAFKIETRFEQNRTMYLIMSAEKWAIYAILLLVLFIAAFNMVGALSMLVLEKKKDIAILRAMGATDSSIRKIFLAEGVLWSLTGGVIGIVLGCLVCWVQQKYGLVKIAGSNFLVENYPVEIQIADVTLVLVTIISVGLLASWYPAVRATSVVEPSLKSS
jgi:lipoprotein-releasing system permease protein